MKDDLETVHFLYIIEFTDYLIHSDLLHAVSER